MKYTVIPLLLLIVSCKNEKIEETTKNQSPIIHKTEEVTQLKNDSEDAKVWLKRSILSYFNASENETEENWKTLTTQDYFSYKNDAMNVEMDVEGSLTEKEFEDKWKSKFNPKKSGIGSGFLISAQDWKKIEITKCELLSEKENAFLFDVNLLDTSFKSNYPIQVKVVKENNKYLIADVLQD